MLCDSTPLSIRKLLRSYERAMGLLCCFRPTNRVWQQPQPVVKGRIGLHVSPFCTPVRATQMPACKRCDSEQLHVQFASPSAPMVRTCHAGADEILIPLHWQNQLVLMVFFGQFRRTTDQPQSLPLWREARINHALNLAGSLQHHLLEIYQQRLAQQPGTADPRLAQVINWLNSNLASDPSLDALAVFLCVSPTWASHLIRQLADKSYTQLKDDLRLRRAKDLLAGSTMKISVIAAQLGMEDANYFSRFFKSKAGVTATDYRKVHQLPMQV
jgi:AraC-like DNA-binding protein